ncbi:MAG: septum site-determining protein MinD [Clostridia bacterium]|nr:septum site-determining protein MinD [Clostridia bacterium]
MGKKIVLTSGKGGVGKTTVTANLGIALSMLSKKVALVDGDIGLNNLDVVMMVENKIVYDIGDIAEGRCRTKQALIQDDCFPSLFTLPSAKTMDNSRIPPRVFVSIVNELNQDFDYVLIDCPAGIDEGFHRAVAGADEALVVTTPHISAVRDADKVVSLLSTYCMKAVGLVVNRLKGNLVTEGATMDAPDIAKLLRVPLKGAIPEDEEINLSSQISKCKDKSSARLAYLLLASYVDGKDTKVFDCASDYRGFFKKLQRVFR